MGQETQQHSKRAKTQVCETGWTVAVNGKVLHTPKGQSLTVPRRSLAERIAGEWNEQTGAIQLETLRLTRLVNEAMDRTPDRRPDLYKAIRQYGAHDLLCYPDTYPRTLRERQIANWTPWLDWGAKILKAPLALSEDVLSVEQPDESLDRLCAHAAQLDDLELTTLVSVAHALGSAILAFALQRKALEPEACLDLVRLGPDWQAEQWGELDEVTADRRNLYIELDMANTVFHE